MKNSDSFLAFFLGFGLLLSLTAPAFADMELSPVRQVITKDSPMVHFEVSNPSDRLLEGRVNWIDLSATQTGYSPATPDARAALSAAPYLEVQPAFFRLEPGKRIRIEIRLRDGVRVPRGERRSHLLVETQATRTPLRKTSENGLQVDVGLGVSAPVILRNSGKAGAKITEAKLLRDDDGLLFLETLVKPTAEHSAYGHMIAEFTPDKDDAETSVLALRANVASFTDTPSRKVELPLGELSLGGGKMTVRYEGREEYEGIIFDERSYTIAPSR